MVPLQGESSSFRFSTDGLPEADRAKAVRELHERTGLPGKIEPLEPLPDCPIRVDITKLALPGLGVMSGTMCGLRQAARPHGTVFGGSDELLLAINLRGSSAAQQADEELMLGDGDAMLATRGSTGFTITRPTLVRFIGFRVPRAAIVPLVGRLDDAPIRFVPRGTEMLNLLAAYAGALVNEQPASAPDLQRLVATHVHDLVATIVGATRDGRAVAEGRGIRAARLRAVKADITANLADCGLTVTGVAMRQRVSPRYVHKLLESEGLTFSAFVLEQRLSQAYRLLSDARLAHRNISSLAFDVGFGDLSYFNRTFRRRYDATPSECRKMMQGRDPP